MCMNMYVCTMYARCADKVTLLMNELNSTCLMSLYGSVHERFNALAWDAKLYIV